MKTLCIMVKAPRLGQVKTRLARQIGSAAAVNAYRVMLRGVLRRLAGGREWRVVLAIAPDAELGSRAIPCGVDRMGQGVGSLGARMQRSIDRLRSGGPVVVIGSDIPAVARRDVRAAFKALSAHDAVIGPAEDGGYWLIGLGLRRRIAPFGGVRWSTEHARADTLRNLKDARVAHLRCLPDVDEAQDWRAWSAQSAFVRLNGY